MDKDTLRAIEIISHLLDDREPRRYTRKFLVEELDRIVEDSGGDWVRYGNGVTPKRVL